jgi:hypothetical protein
LAGRVLPDAVAFPVSVYFGEVSADECARQERILFQQMYVAIASRASGQQQYHGSRALSV